MAAIGTMALAGRLPLEGHNGLNHQPVNREAKMNRLWRTVCFVVVVSFGQNLLSAPAASKWTCWAKISLAGSGNWTYAPPDWSMSGGVLVDREKRCLTHIWGNWTGVGDVGDEKNVAI